ncbi:MAG: thiolase family protein [Bacteroidia bacterium]|nr:thiolase family protein [Bacteroidia bacterium]
MKAFYSKEKGIAISFEDIYLLNGARTPFGKYCGTLGGVSPTDLGIFAGRAALEKAKTRPDEINQVITANIGQSSYDAYFLPRHISLFCNVPMEVPALLVQRICGSGFETMITAAEQITLGKAETILCTGSENMSLSPTASFGNRMGYMLGRPVFKDMLWESLDDTAAGCAMGFTAENVAKKYGITRNDTDTFAKLSFDRAVEAQINNLFKDEIVPVNTTVFEAHGLKPRKLNLPRGVKNFSTDEHFRPTDMESLAKLPPVFCSDGVLTAGNCSGIVDGAAAAVVSTGVSASKKGLKPLAKIVAAASAGIDPRYMGLGPVPVIRLLLERTGLKLDDIGLIEINEAFSAQVIGCERELNLDRAKLNVNGGAIAYGHPLAATGLRLSITIAHELKRRKLKYGIASACIGGGQGTAVLLENTEI